MLAYFSARYRSYPNDDTRRNILALWAAGLTLAISGLIEFFSKQPRTMAVAVIVFAAIVSTVNVVGTGPLRELSLTTQFYVFPLVFGCAALAVSVTPLVQDRATRKALRIAGLLLVLGGLGNLLTRWLGGPSI